MSWGILGCPGVIRLTAKPSSTRSYNILNIQIMLFWSALGRPGVSWGILGCPGVSWGNQTDREVTGGGLSLLRNIKVRLTEQPDMTTAVYR